MGSKYSVLIAATVFACLLPLYLSGIPLMQYIILVAYIPLFMLFFMKKQTQFWKSVCLFYIVNFVLFLCNTIWLRKYDTVFHMLVAGIVAAIYTLVVAATILLSRATKRSIVFGLLMLPFLLAAMYSSLQMIDDFPMQVMPIYMLAPLGWLLKGLGIFGFHLLLFVMQSLAAYALLQRKKQVLLRLAPLAAIILLFGSIILLNQSNAQPSEYGISVAMVQPYDQAFRNERNAQPEQYFRNIYDLAVSAAKVHPDIIIFPEYAFSYPLELSANWSTAFMRLANQTASIIVVGGRGFSGSVHENTAVQFDMMRDPTTDAAYIIYPNMTFDQYVSSSVPPESHVREGEPDALVFARKGVRFGIRICWEEMSFKQARQYQEMGVDYFIIIANDQRFEDNLRPYRLTKDASSVQSALTGIPQIRVANSGISYVTDSNGVIIYQMRPLEKNIGFIRI